MIQKILRVGKRIEDRTRQLFHLHEPEKKIIRDAQEFWTRTPNANNSAWWHLRENNVLSDEQWLRIGSKHLDLYLRWMRMLDADTRPKKVVDWGCGGGANAVDFASICEEIYLVDPSKDAIEESLKQLAIRSAQTRATPVLLDIAEPSAVRKTIPQDIDLFYCLYVFEVLPSKAYGVRLLELANTLLKLGGHAFIQIKYETASWKTRSRAWGYRRDVTNMVSYRIEEFWNEACNVGFVPEAVQLVPRSQEVPDFNYAYYLLRKPA